LRILDQQSVPNHETTDEADGMATEAIDEVAMTDVAVEDTMTGEAVMTDEEAEEVDLVVLVVAEAVDEMTGGGRGPGVMTDEGRKK